MAILNKLFIGACALASLVQAAPVVLTVTDVVTVTEYETVNATTTVFAAMSQSPTVVTTSSLESDVATSTTSSAEQVQQVVSTSAAPATTPAVFVQQPVSQSQITTQAPVATPVPTTLQTTTAALPRSAAVAGGSCEGSGAPCTGDVTHWDGGLGACGWNVNTGSDMQIALPVGMMGSQSNGNPYCGRSVTLKNPTTGATIQATVGDKCMGCTGNSIDCTNVLFNAITGNGDGRVGGIQWWFN